MGSTLSFPQQNMEKVKLCSALALMLSLRVSAGWLSGPRANCHTPECNGPHFPFRSYCWSFKMVLARSSVGLCHGLQNVSTSLLLWFLWSLLNCFVLTGLSHLKTCCWLKTYAGRFFLLFFFIHICKELLHHLATKHMTTRGHHEAALLLHVARTEIQTLRREAVENAGYPRSSFFKICIPHW